METHTVTIRAVIRPIYRRLIAALLLAFVGLLAGGFWQSAHAQSGSVCRELDNVRICGETITEEPSGYFRIEGNVTIGPKDGSPVVIVKESLENGRMQKGYFVHQVLPSAIAAFGSANIVVGSLHFVNTLNQPALLSSFEDFQADELGGIFHLDTKAKRLVVPRVVPLHEEAGKPRNTGILFSFLTTYGIKPLAKEGDSLSVEKMEAGFDLNTRVFTATLPVNLAAPENLEITDLKVTTRIAIDDKGLFTGTLDSFSLQLAGLRMAVEKVNLFPGSATSAGWFEAGTVKVNKADNPGLPNLDPANPDMVFRLEKLRFRDGQWSLGGGSVPLPDWQVGSALKLTKQSIGLTLDQSKETYTLNISTTIGSAGQDAILRPSGVQPMTMRIGARQKDGEWQPYMRTELPNLKPTLWISRLGLQPAGFSMVLDPSEKFFGLTASRVNLLWDASMGGQPNGQLTDLKVGIDSDANLVFNVNGSSVNFPEIRNKTFSGRLTGGFGVKDGVVTVAMSGTVGLNLPSNSGVTTGASITLRSGRNVRSFCASQATDCLLRDEMKFTTFGFKVAGFNFVVENPRGHHGGFAADKARLTMPSGIKSIGAQVSGLSVDGYGNFSMKGGGIELPPIEISGYQFVGLKGNFVKTASGGYEFKAAGILPLPGVDPTAGKRNITAELIFRTTATGNFQGLGVAVNFRTTSPGIPLGTTGMELLEIGGRFDLNQGTAKITVSMRAASQYRIATLPLVSVRGEAAMQVNPFVLTANAQLSVLVLDVASASLGLGAGQGFNGGAGFNVRFEVDSVVVRGQASLRLGNVTLSNGRSQFRWAAQASLSVGLKKNQFARFLPPVDLILTEVAFRGGTFKVKNRGEVAGLIGTVGCCHFFRASVFYDFARNQISHVNADNYSLIDAARVRALAAQNVAGYTSRQMSTDEIASLGLVLASHVDMTQVIQETVPVEVLQTGTTLFGIAYPDGTPNLRLQLPDGTILTEAAVDDIQNTFIREPGVDGEMTQIAFVVEDAPAGSYLLLIDNTPSFYEKVSYTLNGEAVGFATASCSEAAQLPNVTVNCNGQPGGPTATIEWFAFDGDSPDATVMVGYMAVPEEGAQGEQPVIHVLEENVPFETGSYIWNLLEVPTGRYRLVATAFDGQNEPVDFVSDVLIEVIDQRAPQVPDLWAGSGTSLAAGYYLNWPPNLEWDLAGYEIGYGPVNDSSQFVYTRTLGAKEVVTATGMIDAELWGLADNVEVWVGVRTYDQTGNYSEWSPLKNVRPWAVAPKSWRPLPDTNANPDTVIEVAFDTPLEPASLVGALTVLGEDGSPVPGESSQILSVDGTMVLGVRFQPATPLQDGQTYTARLRGNTDGIVTEDGRTMPEDYTWQFTADATVAPVPVDQTPISGLLVTNDSPTIVGNVTVLSAATETGNQVVYLWDLGDGQPAEGGVVNHTYDAPGDYVVTVTARNAINEVIEQTIVQIVPVPQCVDGPECPADVRTIFLPVVKR